MASTTKWVTNLRQSIKNTCGTGWSVRGRESKGELITQVTFRYPDNQGRTAANVNLAWNAKNTTKIITAVEALNDLMTQKNLSLQKAVELRMEPISQDKENKFNRGRLEGVAYRYSEGKLRFHQDFRLLYQLF